MNEDYSNQRENKKNLTEIEDRKDVSGELLGSLDAERRKSARQSEGLGGQI